MEDLTQAPSAASASKARPAIRITLQNGISFVVDAASMPLVIGRSRKCGLCLPFPHVSREHCELVIVGDLVCARDTSTNGTVVDDEVVRGDIVALHKTARLNFAGQVTLIVEPIVRRGPPDEDLRDTVDRRVKANAHIPDRRLEERRSDSDPANPGQAQEGRGSGNTRRRDI